MGSRLTRYCDEHRLSVDARLALFRQVLEAVGFAHSRLVIHRDLKSYEHPRRGNGQVKLLDFGVANLLSDRSARIAPAGAPQLEAMTPDKRFAGTARRTAARHDQRRVFAGRGGSTSCCAAPSPMP